MDRFKRKYKETSSNPSDQRQKRIRAFVNERKGNRGRSYAAQRNISGTGEMEENNDVLQKPNNENEQITKQDTGVNKRKQLLQKWKEEKQKLRQKEMKAKARSRPPFKAGFVHHTVTPLADVPPAPANLLTTKTAKVHTFETKFHVGVPHSDTVLQASNQNKRVLSSRLPLVKEQRSNQMPTKPTPQTRNLRSRVITIVNTPIIQRETTIHSPTLLNKRQQQGRKAPNTPYFNPRSHVKTTPASCKIGRTPVLVGSVKTRGRVAKEVNVNKKDYASKHTVPQTIKPAQRETGIKSEQNVTHEKTPQISNVSRETSITVDKYVSTKPTLTDKAKTPVQQVLVVDKPVSVKKQSTTDMNVSLRSVSAKSKTPMKRATENTKTPVKQSTRQSPRKVATSAKKVISPKNLGSGKEEHDCLYFRQILANTITMLERHCDYWENEQKKAGDAVTEVANEQLLLATGMARLIIREKFAQFRGLIENCEANSVETKTTCTDLQGFWDMIYIQVEDIEKKFKELENMKRNNWVPLEPSKVGQVQKKKFGPTKPKPTLPKGKSNFRAFLAARKNQDSDKSMSVEMAVDVAIENKPVAEVTRRSLMRNSVGSPMQRKRIDSPKVNAIFSASRIAKSAGRKSFSQDNNSKVGSSMGNTIKSKDQFQGTPKRASTRHYAPATPLQGILKPAGCTPTPQSLTKKAVVFSVPFLDELEEDDVLKTPIPDIKRTYGHPQSPVSPAQDQLFDELFLTANSFPPKIPSDDEAINLNESYTIEEHTSTGISSSRTLKPPTPYVRRRRGRTSARFSPYASAGAEADVTSVSEVDMETDTLSQVSDIIEEATSSVPLSPLKNQLKKLSVSAESKLSLLYTPDGSSSDDQNIRSSGDKHDDSVVTSTTHRRGRRSSRIPVPILNDVANLQNLPEHTIYTTKRGRRSSKVNTTTMNTSDLICWDSPVGNPRRSMRARKSTSS